MTLPTFEQRRRNRILLLAIETTCDETGAAVLAGDEHSARPVPVVLSSVVASQIDIHRRFGGVVPEMASREHVRQILPVIEEAIRLAEIDFADLDVIAVATRPGLVGSLVVGLTAAKSLALTLGKPLVAVDHLEGHLYASQIAYPTQDVYPCVGLVVSGGHTSLFHCRDPLNHLLLGGTIDDAAGEAFDKVASLLGLGYPGGPQIDRVAKNGDPLAFAFPRAFIHDETPAFSFSGLKTAVLQALKGKQFQLTGTSPPAQLTADIAASFQKAVVDVLVVKTEQTLRKTRLKKLGIGGGVAVNSHFRERMQELAERCEVELFIPPISLCTDNAAMAGIALPKFLAGEVADLDIDVAAGLVRPPSLKKGINPAGAIEKSGG